MKTLFLWHVLCWAPAVVYAKPSECPGCDGALTAMESTNTLLGTRAPNVFDSDCPLACPKGRVCVVSFTRGPMCTTDKGYPPNLRRPIFADGGNSSVSAQALIGRHSSPEKRSTISDAMATLGGAILDQALGFALGPVFDLILGGGGNNNADLVKSFEKIADRIVADIKNIVSFEMTAQWQNRDEKRMVGILSEIDKIPDTTIPTEASNEADFRDFEGRLDSLFQGGDSLPQTLLHLANSEYTIHVAPFYLLGASAQIGLQLERIRAAKLRAAKGGPNNTAEYTRQIKTDAGRFAVHMDKLQKQAMDLIKPDCKYRETGQSIRGVGQAGVDYLTVSCERWATIKLPDGKEVTFRGPTPHQLTNRCTGGFGSCSNGDKSKATRECRDESEKLFCPHLFMERAEIRDHFMWHGPQGPSMLTPEWKYVYRYFRHIEANGGIDTFDPDCWTNNFKSANPFPGLGP